jgi:hypothetical protein
MHSLLHVSVDTRPPSGSECILIQCNFRILKTLCAFVGDNKTNIFYEMHGEVIKKTECLHDQ